MSESILNGSYQAPPGTTRPTKTFLKACQRPSNYMPLSYDFLSYAHYRKAWASVRENTGSGKIHFGHWKAGILNDTIGHAEWTLTTLPAKHGFSPIVWQTATDVMIVKKAGELDLDRLQTIVLYEADYNFLNKCLG